MEEIRRELSSLFDGMMRTLYRLEGSSLRIEVLETPAVREFAETHAAALDSSFQKVGMTEAMRRRLQRSDYVFSGMKAFHELNEAFPSLLDENGERKPFERFLNDVRKIDETYNSNYLRAEYNFVQASAEMAARWEQFIEDGDRYYLQYRTAHDDKVRPEHAELDGITLPVTDTFWEEYYPPLSFGCRCSVVQVRKSKYPATPHDEAMALGNSALEKEKHADMFRFNSGIKGKTMPDYNPYTIRRCNGCDLAKKTGLAKAIPENQLCAACRIVREMAKADARTARQRAKALQGTTITNPQFPHPVTVSGRSIKEWTNQPFRNFEAKNRMLADIAEVMKAAKYLGAMPYHKNSDVRLSHIFETKVAGEKAWIIVREYTWGEFVLHSISDNPEILQHL
ncbi:Phage Mu protein F like protein [Bacteroides uniformis]|uniref:LPD3 domain-containing protein n=1 Tax=Bacteroidaceae TaxID=815 RepID=UPI001BE22B01|nr:MULTISPECIES: phage minor head protein [Bacteroidaceae]MBT0708808.1 Phage Mu protein F like protein [Phocaeicola vulgatus]QUT34391.1 Phage Mu protein F like protein [Bacteroides uniformis]